MSGRPRLLDLFAGAGGAAMGYHRAGFDVVGVDIKPQPNYPFEFVEGDAMEFLASISREGNQVIANGGWYSLRMFDAIHASPPCQAYSVANNIHGRTDHPELIDATRRLLVASGLPYVIENVEGARPRMVNPVTVCGLSLGCNVRRHRLFECSFPVMVPPCAYHDSDYLLVFGGGTRIRGTVIGKAKGGGNRIKRGTVPIEQGRAAMGIDWMTRDELSEAIPPAYTEHIGAYLLAAVERAAA